jgi:hypothetical protein
MQIEKIAFKSALLADRKQAKELPVKKWDREELPKEIKELLEKDKPWDLSGCYGDPLFADSIIYQPISFIGKGRTEVTEVFKLGVIFSWLETISFEGYSDAWCSLKICLKDCLRT